MKRFLQRVRFALQGWFAFFRAETHGKIQAVISLLVLAAALFFRISPMEWIAVLLCIGMVLAAEMVNTAIEKLADHLHPEHHPGIGKVKDIAAGAVLWLAVIAVVIGAIIFWPYIMNLL